MGVYENRVKRLHDHVIKNEKKAAELRAKEAAKTEDVEKKPAAKKTTTKE